MAARRASLITSPVRKAKRYVKEAVLGVIGTAVAAGLLAAFGINGNNPFASDPNSAQGKLAKVVENAAVEAKEKVAEAAHEGKLPSLNVGAQKTIESLLGSSDSNDPIVGKWEQLVYNPQNSQWYSGGIFRVSGRSGSYSVAYLDYSRTPGRFCHGSGHCGYHLRQRRVGLHLENRHWRSPQLQVAPRRRANLPGLLLPKRSASRREHLAPCALVLVEQLSQLLSV